MKYLILLVTTISILTSSFTFDYSRKKSIKLTYYIDDVEQELGKEDRFLFVNDKDSLESKIDNRDYLILPENLNHKEYSVIFIHGKDTLNFKNIDTVMLIPDQNFEWRLGIDNRPFNSFLGFLSYDEYRTDTTTRKLIYWQFRALDYGDGFQTFYKVN